MNMKNFSCNKKELTSEFQDPDSENLINLLGVIDDLYILFVSQKFHDIQLINNILRCDIFHLVREKWKMSN